MNDIIYNTYLLFDDSVKIVESCPLLSMLSSRQQEQEFYQNRILEEKKKKEHKEHNRIIELNSKIRFNNYAKLKENGYNKYSNVLDTTPLTYYSNLTYGEYLNIHPIGLNKAERKNYYKKREQQLFQLIFYVKSLEERIKKSKQKQRILDYISSFNKVYFISLNLDDKNLKMDYRRKITAIFNKLGVNYVFISDYGDNMRLHFHGFISTNDFIEKNLTFSGHYSKKHHAKKYNLEILEKSLGFCPIEDCSEDRFNNSVNYCLKYAFKPNQEHFVIRSRTKGGKKCLKID